jgi:hypothetical protein
MQRPCLPIFLVIMSWHPSVQGFQVDVCDAVFHLCNAISIAGLALSRWARRTFVLSDRKACKLGYYIVLSLFTYAAFKCHHLE